MSDRTDSHRETVGAHLDVRPGELPSNADEAVYREIFDHLPVSIWVEDWSPVKAMVDRLAHQGVTDWRRYFESRPDQTMEAADAIDVIDVSAATLDLYGSDSKDEVVKTTLGAEMSAGEMEAFREQLIALAKGETRVTIDADEVALDGSAIVTRMQTVIPPEHRDCWSRVVTAVEDITERMPAAGTVVLERREPDAGSDASSKADLALWDSIKDSTSPADYTAYLENFPTGIFVALARRRAARLSAETDAGVSQSPPSDCANRLAPTPPGPRLDFDRLRDKAKENTERALRGNGRHHAPQ